MEINLVSIGGMAIVITQTQLLGLFWAFMVAISFNLAYFFFSVDRRGQQQIPGSARRIPSSARTALTSFIGTLIVIGTYASMLSEQSFELADCTMLALVAAHGWMAEDMVNQFLQRGV